jgi:large subunit ribosomal protein L29
MKFKELKDMGEGELKDKLVEIKKELMKIYSQTALGSNPKESGKIKDLRRTYARIKTVLNQNQKKEKEQKRNRS